MRDEDHGQILFVGFGGTELSVGLAAFLRDIRPGGIILFKRNIADPDQTFRLIRDLKGLYDPRPVIAVDEEGGQVSRLSPAAPTLPPAALLAGRGAPDDTRALAAALGRQLASLGFDLDFAPVVDLCRPDAPNGIGDRSFSTDPEIVVSHAAAFLEGLAEAGVAGCLKHFPGLGPTLFDSHHHLPTVQKEENGFRAEDLLPYRRLHALAPVVMIGHGHYPFLAGPLPVAATLTPRVALDLLRSEIGFTGLALADDLEMKAVSSRISFDELAPRVIGAGCDMALVCRDIEAIRRSRAAIGAWAADGRLPAARLGEAIGRVKRFREAILGASKRPAASMEAFAAARADLESRLSAFA